MTSNQLRGVFFDVGGTLLVEEPGKHLWEMVLQPVAGAQQVLAELKARFRLGVISNTVGSGDREVQQVLQEAGLWSMIDALVTSRDFGRAKPDPSIFREAARRLQLPLDTTCMVGDRLETDIAGAIKAGIPGVWLRSEGAVPIDGIEPTHVIRSLLELPAWIDATYTRRQG